MKRSPLKRSQKPMKRSPMKRVSTKKRKQTSKFGPIRAAFKKELGCPCGRIASDCHEIFGGGVRCKTFELREFWLAACREHHEKIQGWTKPKQCALKAIVDPDWFSLDKLNEYAIRKVSESDVAKVVQEVRSWIASVRVYK